MISFLTFFIVDNDFDTLNLKNSLTFKSRPHNHKNPVAFHFIKIYNVDF